MKLREGNVFQGVCLQEGGLPPGGGSAPRRGVYNQRGSASRGGLPAEGFPAFRSVSTLLPVLTSGDEDRSVTVIINAGMHTCQIE